MSNDQNLSSIDRLVEVEEKTNSNGTVDVTIQGWQEVSDNQVRVDFITPLGDEKSERMPFPQPGGDLEEYKFYRLIRNAGYEMRNADLIEGEVVPADVSEKASRGVRWSLHVEKRKVTTPKSERLKQWVASKNWMKIAISGVWFFVVGLLMLAVVTVI